MVAQVKRLIYTLERRVDGSQNLVLCSGEGKSLCFCQDSKPAASDPLQGNTKEMINNTK